MGHDVHIGGGLVVGAGGHARVQLEGFCDDRRNAQPEAQMGEEGEEDSQQQPIRDAQ